MSQQEVVAPVSVAMTATGILAETKKLVQNNPSAGTNVETVLIGNLKLWNKRLSDIRTDLQVFRVTAKATGQLLAKLKAKRLDADRRGGGAATSNLTKEINTGRSVINQSRELTETARKDRTYYMNVRNAVLDALRLHYIEITQG